MFLLHIRLLFLALCNSFLCLALQDDLSHQGRYQGRSLGTERECQNPTSTVSEQETVDNSNFVSAHMRIPEQPPSGSSLPVIVTEQDSSSMRDDQDASKTAKKESENVVTVTSLVYTTTSVSVFVSSDAPASMPSPSNAYQVLSAARASLSREILASSTLATRATASHRGSSIVVASSSSEGRRVLSGATFTLDGFSYTAYRLDELNQATVVIQGKPTTATVVSDQPVTLPVDEVVSLDLNGNPIVSGSTVYLTAMPTASAALLTGAMSISSTSERISRSSGLASASAGFSNTMNSTQSTTHRPSTVVWGNGRSTESSTWLSSAATVPPAEKNWSLLVAVIIGFATMLIRL